MQYCTLRNFLVGLLVLSHVVGLMGCSTTTQMTLASSQIPVGANYKVLSVVLKDGNLITFDRNGGAYQASSSGGSSHFAISGKSEGKVVVIEPENILEVRLEQTVANGGGSFLAGLFVGMPLGAGVFVLFIVAAYSGS